VKTVHNSHSSKASNAVLLTRRRAVRRWSPSVSLERAIWCRLHRSVFTRQSWPLQLRTREGADTNIGQAIAKRDWVFPFPSVPYPFQLTVYWCYNQMLLKTRTSLNESRIITIQDRRNFTLRWSWKWRWRKSAVSTLHTRVVRNTVISIKALKLHSENNL
jgi:hypothetical protein